MFKKISILFFLFVASLAFAALDDEERVQQFSSLIIVNKDASIDVTERITVFANQHKIRHGIVRWLPINYSDSYGIRHNTKYDLKKVLFNDNNSDFHVRYGNNQFIIYVGSGNTTLARGTYTYTLQYHIKNAVNFLQDQDELYWNITGNSWDFPIMQTNATIILPTEATISRYAGYTGKMGAREQNFSVSQAAGNRITFVTNQPLTPGQGLTVGVAWPKGIVQQPSFTKASNILSTPSEHLVLEIAFIILIYYFIVWYLYGRDIPKGPIVPLFEPPDNLSPAAVRFIVKMGYDLKIFTAALISMATKSFLKIENKNDEFYLKKISSTDEFANDQLLSDDEKRVADSLFGTTDTVPVINSSAQKINVSQKSLHTFLKKNCQDRYFKTNFIYLIPGLIFTALAFIAVVVGAIDKGNTAFALVFLFVWMLGCYTLVNRSLVSIKMVYYNFSFSGLFNALFSSLFALPFLAALIFIFYTFTTGIPVLTISVLFLLFLILLLNFIFYHLLYVPTMKGRKIMDQVLGFKLFLGTTERYRLDEFHPPKQTLELFEKYLPYAIALDVENAWSDQFNSVLKNAGEEPYHPTWYSGTTWRGAPVFAHSLSGSLSNAITTSSISGSSSGSGGGGSSGGGGGGGGGGGW